MPAARQTTALIRTPLTSAAGTTWTVEPAGPLPPQVTGLDRPLPATVPGEVHADLLAAAIIPDPFDGLNEATVSWIGETDWRWRATFDWDTGARTEQQHQLVVSGLDTVAAVILNGTEVGRAANQHRTHRFDLGSVLRDGTNTLEVQITGPYPAARQAEDRLGARPKAYDRPFNALRKMASAYGWDWGPDLAGAGILGDVAVESWSDLRVHEVVVRARWQDGARLGVDVIVDRVDGADPSTAELTLRCAGSETSTLMGGDQSLARLELEVADAAAWWPRGHGDQPLYDVVLLLDGEPVWGRSVGFRTVAVRTDPDAAGIGFVISVNGREVYVRGANWIPGDALMSRLTPELYRARIADAAEAGMNLLRVWGGGIYESEAFYQACDEAGILVWQDFLFACAAYSEAEPLRREVEAEAREAISRLSAHPSLAVWNGNNENIWGYVDWGWAAQLGDQSWGDGYYTELLPALVAELVAGTPYLPGSPYSFGPYRYPNDPRAGTMHIWDVWNARDYSVYAHYRPRFVSEFGFQGPPAWSTLTSVVHDHPLDPNGPQMLNHQKAHEGNAKLARGLGDHLPSWPVRDGVVEMDDWHWLTSLNQARAVAFGITHFRSLAPHNTGAIVWQLNDNWPVISWAAVDAKGIRKPLWHALRRVYADRLAAIVTRPTRPGVFVDLSGGDPGAGELTLVLHNDSEQPWSSELLIRRRRTGVGSPVLAEQSTPIEVPARGRLDVALDEAIRTPEDPTAELIEVSAGAQVLTHGWFVEDTQLRLPPPEQAYRVECHVVPGGVEVRVSAEAVVKDLFCFVDRLDADARVDSGLVTLTAGREHTFVVTCERALDPAQLAVGPVLRSVNDLIGR